MKKTNDYTTCFAYCNGDCACLTEPLCSNGKDCAFFKTAYQLEKELEITDARLQDLGLSSLIKKKYKM